MPEALPEKLTLDALGTWQRVSPTYVVVVIVETIVSGAVMAAVVGVVWLLLHPWWASILFLAVAVITVIMLIVAPRRARAIGYRLRNDDLLFHRGIMFQRFVSVPYGRMQLIDINRGPVGRVLGLSDLRFVTASAATGVSIPGLPDQVAADLRDQLVELAERRRVGL